VYVWKCVSLFNLAEFLCKCIVPILIVNRSSDELCNLPHDQFYTYHSVFIMPTESLTCCKTLWSWRFKYLDLCFMILCWKFCLRLDCIVHILYIRPSVRPSTHPSIHPGIMIIFFCRWVLLFNNTATNFLIQDVFWMNDSYSAVV
jgi:hypothetical protein